MITFLLRALRDRLYRDLRADHDDLRRRVLAGEAATDALLHRLTTEVEIVKLTTMTCGDVGGGVRCFSTLQTRDEPCASPRCPIPDAAERAAELRAELEGR